MLLNNVVQEEQRQCMRMPSTWRYGEDFLKWSKWGFGATLDFRSECVWKPDITELWRTENWLPQAKQMKEWEVNAIDGVPWVLQSTLRVAANINHYWTFSWQQWWECQPGPGKDGPVGWGREGTTYYSILCVCVLKKLTLCNSWSLSI